MGVFMQIRVRLPADIEGADIRLGRMFEFACSACMLPVGLVSEVHVATTIRSVLPGGESYIAETLCM